MLKSFMFTLALAIAAAAATPAMAEQSPAYVVLMAEVRAVSGPGADAAATPLGSGLIEMRTVVGRTAQVSHYTERPTFSYCETDQVTAADDQSAVADKMRCHSAQLKEGYLLRATPVRVDAAGNLTTDMVYEGVMLDSNAQVVVGSVSYDIPSTRNVHVTRQLVIPRGGASVTEFELAGTRYAINVRDART